MLSLYRAARERGTFEMLPTLAPSTRRAQRIGHHQKRAPNPDIATPRRIDWRSADTLASAPHISALRAGSDWISTTPSLGQRTPEHLLSHPNPQPQGETPHD